MGILSKEVNRDGVISRMIRGMFDFDAESQCEFALKGFWVCYLAHIMVLALIVFPTTMLVSSSLGNDGIETVMIFLTSSESIFMLPYIMAALVGLMLIVVAVVVAIVLPACYLNILLITGEWKIDEQSEKLSNCEYMPWFNATLRRLHRKIGRTKDKFLSKYCKPMTYKDD